MAVDNSRSKELKSTKVSIDGLGEVIVTNSRLSNRLKLSVSSGRIRISKPKLVPLSSTIKFIEKNRQWIETKLSKSLENRLIHEGDVISREVTVRFIPSDDDKSVIRLRKSVLEVHTSSNTKMTDLDLQDEIIKIMIPQWRQEAKLYLPGRLDYLAKLHGFSYQNLRLKNIHTRWGSCTSKGNINLNIQLMRISDDLIDHVILHELAHTKAMNHGSDFWQIFTSIRPEAKAERKRLKQMTIF